MRRRIRELKSDFSMSGTLRDQAPVNLRIGQQIRGGNDSLSNDVEAAASKERQDSESLPKAVAVYVSDGKGNVLTVTRNIKTRGPNPTDVNMPGGIVDPGEEPEDAAARELFEETGIIAHKLIPIYSEVSEGKLTTTYKVTSWSGEVKSSWEGDATWQKPEALLKSTFGDYFRKVMNALRM
jgi:8-oxo-dGTP pyrophosphatase MutT (NUDIX family)